MKKKCIYCRERDPEVPDRTKIGKPIKRVCLKCHGYLIANDLYKFLEKNLKQYVKPR